MITHGETSLVLISSYSYCLSPLCYTSFSFLHTCFPVAFYFSACSLPLPHINKITTTSHTSRLSPVTNRPSHPHFQWLSMTWSMMDYRTPSVVPPITNCNDPSSSTSIRIHTRSSTVNSVRQPYHAKLRVFPHWVF